MTITTTITALPTPPSRSDPANFAARGDELLGALPTLVTQINAVGTEANATAAAINTSQTAAAASAASAQADRVLAQQAKTAIDAQSPIVNAAAAAASAAAAAVYASQAQATTPDAPIRLNPHTIRADFALPAGYNGASAGPITLSPNITVTVSDGATWSIA